MRHAPPRADRERVIGVLTAQLDDAYQVGIWRGIEARARFRGVGVVTFVGQRVGAPDGVERATNVAFEMAHRRSVQGLIVITSAIATYLDAAGIEELFGRRRSLPQVSVGVKVRNVPSVTVDGSGALRVVIRHLARDHGRKAFAVIDGPQGHQEAANRAAVLRGTLTELGIPLDPRLAAAGTFVRDSGARAALELISTGLPLDALVCMNDSMALGAMDVLRQEGLRIPEDIAVVGFDGIEEGQYVTPPLTTVNQPLAELGSRAVDAVVDPMDGEDAHDLVLGCEPRIRQSCGCPPRRTYDPSLREPPKGTASWERRAIRELVDLAKGRDPLRFVSRLDNALSRTALEGGDVGRWNTYLSVVSNRAGRKNTALFEQAHVLVGETRSRLEAASRVAAEARYSRLRGFSASLAGAFDMPMMLKRLDDGLRRLSIDGAYLAVFDAPDESPKRARLLMTPDGGLPLPGRGLAYGTASLLPSRAGSDWKGRQWVLEPLVFQTERLGFLLLPGGVREPAVYDTLRDHLGSALKGALLLEQITTHERRLEQEVRRRTAQVTKTNRELTMEMERRKRLEREVIEISNRTMQRIGQDLHDDLCQHLAGIAMLASVLRGELEAASIESVASIRRIGDLLEDSIARAKRIARGLYPAGLAEHGLAAAVEELVEAARRSFPAVIDFRASPRLDRPSTDQALQVYRIVQEALTNSLRHSGSSHIEVRLWQDDQHNGRPDSTLMAEVRDWGEGLPNSQSAHGMGLRIMRYRAELAGAELTIESCRPGTRVTCAIHFGRERKSDG